MHVFYGRKLFTAVAIAAYMAMPGPVLAQSDPPAKKAPSSSGQQQPQGQTGTTSTDSSTGSPPSSPQGEAPSDMQAKPKGEDKGGAK